MEVDTARTIVSVFSVIHWFSAALFALGALAALIIGPAVFTLLAAMHPVLAGILSGVTVVLALLLVALAIGNSFVAYGLAKHKAWARTACLIAAVCAVLSIAEGNFIGLVIGIAEIWFFGFDKTVKDVFDE